MKLFVIKKEEYSILSPIGWTLLFIFELVTLIYWNFISNKPFGIYTAWINILCFFGGIALGDTIEESFFEIIKNIKNKYTNSNN